MSDISLPPLPPFETGSQQDASEDEQGGHDPPGHQVPTNISKNSYFSTQRQMIIFDLFFSWIGYSVLGGRVVRS